jgi:hypothetical protein
MPKTIVTHAQNGLLYSPDPKGRPKGNPANFLFSRKRLHGFANFSIAVQSRA